MEAQYLDRLLACSDCHSEFIFTAGEQLFFHDKQFVNDPKRCKPCKSRRAGLAAAAHGTGPSAAGISRTETRTECSECGVETTVPFKPTQGRPVLCRHCFQLKGKGLLPVAAVAVTSPNVQTEVALTEASTNTYGAIMSPDAAVLAAASMAAASPESSVASAADLASIGNFAETHDQAVVGSSAIEIPTSLITVIESVPAELIAAAAEAPEA